MPEPSFVTRTSPSFFRVSFVEHPSLGVGYLQLVPCSRRGGMIRSKAVGDDLVLDFDHQGRVVGIEFLRLSRAPEMDPCEPPGQS